MCARATGGPGRRRPHGPGRRAVGGRNGAGRGAAAGVVRGDVGPDDVRRLVCGMREAATAGGVTVADPDRYVEILLTGLRPLRG
ncbi:hypothetical protein [Curtobacterium sp. MCPF17_011]|uniref:SbtR family transcriptional regulator n=1 Tax=unclassified Curtobacterium TaxID=257496 RepID=UPI0035C8D94A